MSPLYDDSTEADDELNRVHYVLCLTVYLPAIVFALLWAVTT